MRSRAWPARLRALALLVGVVTLGCQRREPSPQELAIRSHAVSPRASVFDDATARSGLVFQHENSASERRLLPETLGAGVAALDFDGDGWSDLALANSGSLHQGGAVILLRNLGAGRFAPEGIALPTPGLYVLGLAVGDFDNDGDPDLLATGVGRQRLFENRGDGTFVVSPTELPPTAVGFGSGAAFFDADRDGWLDLVIGRYVRWSATTDKVCLPDGVHRAYCTPEIYPGETNLFFVNRRGRGFVERSEASGLAVEAGKTLGVAVSDLDGDGDLDVAFANDTSRNSLFLSQGDGTFREVAVEAGFAFSESGATRGGMGIGAGDLDGDGRIDLVVGNFAQEMSAYYRALPVPGGGVQYVDDAAQAGLGLPTLLTLAFGTLVFDYDGDGALDIALANGHIEPEIAAIRRGQSYAQPMQLFGNDGSGHFEPVDDGPGSALAAPRVGRGLAAGDFDRDGDPDLLLTENGGPAHLFQNQVSGSRWLRLELMAASGNATPFGARARTIVGGRARERELGAGGSYLSTSEPVLTLGVGGAERVEVLEIRWPAGLVQRFRGLPATASYRLVEPGNG